MAEGKRGRRIRRWKIGGVAVWAVLVMLFALWQTTDYRGVIALFAEWQFNLAGRYYPALTFLLFVGALILPGMLLFVRVKDRQSYRRLHLATLRSARTFERLLLGVGGAFVVGALIVCAMMLALPSDRGSRQEIDLSKPLFSMPEDGASAITGRVLYGRTAAFSDDLLIASRDIRIAPIVAPQGSGPDLQFFVELAPRATMTGGELPNSFSGILQRNALPGELVKLYRYAGYRIEPPYYVLFTDRASLRWPYEEAGVQLALLGFVFLAVGVWQRRRVHAIIAEMEQSNLTVATAI